MVVQRVSPGMGIYPGGGAVDDTMDRCLDKGGILFGDVVEKGGGSKISLNPCSP